MIRSVTEEQKVTVMFGVKSWNKNKDAWDSRNEEPEPRGLG